MANTRMWVRNHLFTFLSLTIKGQPVEKGYLLQRKGIDLEGAI